MKDASVRAVWRIATALLVLILCLGMSACGPEEDVRYPKPKTPLPTLSPTPAATSTPAVSG